jgi:hypothetical protein
MNFNKGPVRLGDWLISIEDVSPDVADRMLSNMVSNRMVRTRNVKAFSEQMKKGEWMLTHQGIAIGADGRVMDGQHRLMSIIRSGVKQEMLVFRGINNNLFPVVDKGSSRSLKDVYSLIHKDKTEYASRVVSMAKHILFGTNKARRANSRSFLSDYQLAKYADQHKDMLIPICRVAYTGNGKAIMSSGWMAAIAMDEILNKKGRHIELSEDLVETNWRGQNDPLKMAYQFINRKKMGVTRGLMSDELSTLSYIAIVKALLARDSGKEIKSLQVRSGLTEFPGAEEYRKNKIKELSNIKI